MKDHARRVLRLIGDPERRYREDPVRMLRAVRFSSKLGFTIDPASNDVIKEMSGLLSQIPAARLYDEVLKLFLSGVAVQTFEQLCRYHLFGMLFSETQRPLRATKMVLVMNFWSRLWKIQIPESGRASLLRLISCWRRSCGSR